MPKLHRDASTAVVVALAAALAGCGGGAAAGGAATARTASGETVAIAGAPASRAVAPALAGRGILGRYSAELQPINELASRIGALTARYPDGVGGPVRIDNADYGATRASPDTRTRRNVAAHQPHRDNMDPLVLTGAFTPIDASTPGAGEIYGSYLGPLNVSEADGSGRGPGAFSAVEMADDDEAPMTINCEYVVSRVEPNSGGVCRAQSDDRGEDGAMWLLVF